MVTIIAPQNEKNKPEHPPIGADSLYIFRPNFSISFFWKHKHIFKSPHTPSKSFNTPSNLSLKFLPQTYYIKTAPLPAPQPASNLPHSQPHNYHGAYYI